MLHDKAIGATSVDIYTKLIEGVQYFLNLTITIGICILVYYMFWLLLQRFVLEKVAKKLIDDSIRKLKDEKIVGKD